MLGHVFVKIVAHKAAVAILALAVSSGVDVVSTRQYLTRQRGLPPAGQAYIGTDGLRRISLGYHELDPIYGRNPSTLRLAVTMGAALGLSAWALHRYPDSKWRQLAVWGMTAGHTYGALHNWADMPPRRSVQRKP